MNLNDFLNCGCFLAVPKLNKVWILTNISSFENKLENELAFYKNNFFLTEKNPWLKGKHHYEMTFHDFKKILDEQKFSPPNIQWNELNFENYKKQFYSLKKEIEQGNLIKGVPFAHQSSQYHLNKKNLVYLIKSIFSYEKNENLYLYGFWNLNQEQGFLGASPELLFTQNNNSIDTFALAGTIHNSKLNQEIDPKIIREHNFVIDGIKEDLSYLGNINTKKTELLTLEKFSHLKTALKFNLKDKFDFQQVLTAIHPTPALGAFPKNIGNEWLYNIEENIEKRFNYCCPFGISLDNNFSLCIGVIRCLQWNHGVLRVTAGGGVIAESIFEDECEEICMKIDSVKNYFNIQ